MERVNCNVSLIDDNCSLDSIGPLDEVRATSRPADGSISEQLPGLAEVSFHTRRITGSEVQTRRDGVSLPLVTFTSGKIPGNGGCVGRVTPSVNQ